MHCDNYKDKNRYKIINTSMVGGRGIRYGKAFQRKGDMH